MDELKVVNTVNLQNIESVLADPDFAITLLQRYKAEKEARKSAEQRVEQLEATVDTKQNTIDILVNQILRLSDRAFCNKLVRRVSYDTTKDYGANYRDLYSIILTQCGIDVYARVKNKKDSKIATITNAEWQKVVPVLVAWYLRKGGSEEYLKELTKG